MKAIQQKKGALYTEILILGMMLFKLAAAQESPFNLEVQIVETHKSMQAGEDLWFTTKILNLAGQQRMDITLNYHILNAQRGIIAAKSETLAIETQASFVGNLKVPENTPEGDYEVEVRLVAGNMEEARGKDSFRIIKENDEDSWKWIAIPLAALSLIILVFAVIALKKIIEKMKIKLKIHEIVKKRNQKLRVS